jgi:uncharacterized coiled-coil protein SlyX
MLEILKSERFQEEYKMYQASIDAIANSDIRAQAEILLKSLVNEVRKLDNQHQEMFSGNQIPMALGDSRLGITQLRKKLDVLCKELKTLKK